MKLDNSSKTTFFYSDCMLSHKASLIISIYACEISDFLRKCQTLNKYQPLINAEIKIKINPIWILLKGKPYVRKTC